MNNSLLYVEPIYIQSEDEKTAIPELRRVVIGYENEVVWGETLEDALDEMFGQRTRRRITEVTATPEATGDQTDQLSVRELIQQANQHFNEAQSAQRAGDWTEYGRSLQLLEETLQQLDGNTQ